MTTERRQIDWPAVYARLEQLRHAVEAEAERTPTEIEEIRRARARTFARHLEQPPDSGEMLDLLLFSLADSRYAVETQHVTEVIALRDLSPLPRTPSFLAGVIHHRGRILPVLDVHRFLGFPADGASPARSAVAVHIREVRLAILAQEVVGLSRTPVQDIAPPPLSPHGGRTPWIRGVTSQMVAVVDLEALARDPRLMVNEEVQAT